MSKRSKRPGKGKHLPLETAGEASAPWRNLALIALALAVATVVVYLPVFENDFVNYDDDYYITDNPHLRLGLSAEGLRWAFTESYGANWYPLTWLSYMVDYELAGFSPGWIHGVNLVLHVMSVVLLFFVFVRMTGSPGASAFVAAVFALHPLHVESVAWAAERKDVLSGLLWILTMGAYVRYCETKTPWRYALVASFLALGLLSKPMVVTLPFVLLLLDVWPLERFSRASWRRLVVEKIPLFVLVGVASAVTFYAQRAEGAVQSLETYSFAVRLQNALVAYVAYIGKAFWPAGLSPYYPHPGDTIPIWQAGAALAVIAVTTVAAVWLAWRDRRLACLPVGWLWYLGTLVPVIGLIQVGQQAMADRYTYLPYIGLSIVVGYGLAEVVRRWNAPRALLIAGGTLACLALAVVASAQVRIWRDSVTLFEHALSVTNDNALAHVNLGVAYLNGGRLDDAASELQQAIRIHPGSAEAHAALGAVRAHQERTEDALELYRTSLRLDPSSVRAHRDFGNLLLKLGDSDQALVHFREAVALAPKDGDALLDEAVALSRQGRFEEAVRLFQEARTTTTDPARLEHNWGTILFQRGELDEAAKHFDNALALRPDYAEALFSRGQLALGTGDFGAAKRYLAEASRLQPNDEGTHVHLGIALVNSGDVEEGFGHFDVALSLNPDRAETHHAIGLALARLGELERAVEQFHRALELDPTNAEGHYSLGLVLAGLGRFDEAILKYERALEIAPDYAEAVNSWGVALASWGQIGSAVEQFRRALEINPRLGQAHNNWGLALAQQGALDSAVEHFRAAVELEPANADGYNNLGVTLARLGDVEGAARSFERAVAIAPNHPSARRNLEGARRALETRQAPP